MDHRFWMHRAARGDGAAACRESEAPYERFLPLETLRDDISLIRVLHDAVTLSDMDDMGPILPLLSASPDAAMPAIAGSPRTARVRRISPHALNYVRRISGNLQETPINFRLKREVTRARGISRDGVQSAIGRGKRAVGVFR
ncbi:hypothetical protein [Caballeronia glebae]|uniref:hypothetical protein n=1 Tax=Caballeronia glebae TaxID=1777143 RepID=UPI0038B8A7E9